jgi:hypothetical protein
MRSTLSMLKLIARLAVFLSAAILASANLYVPKAKLAGETVQVILDATNAEVSAIFEFEDWMTLDEKIVYFPIFGYPTSNAIQVLTEAKFELEAADKKLHIALPCEPPERFKDLSKTYNIHWYSVNLDHLFEGEVPSVGHNSIIKFRYIQPLIAGKFHYLPVIIGRSNYETSARAWQYQMHVRSFIKVPQVLSMKSSYERLGDSVVVYLKHGEIVEIQ